MADTQPLPAGTPSAPLAEGAGEPSAPPAEGAGEPSAPPAEAEERATEQIQQLFNDKGLNKFVGFISSQPETSEILQQLKQKLEPRFKDEISSKIPENNELVMKIIEIINSLFSFVLYSTFNRINAKSMLDEFRACNPEANLDIINSMDTLVSKGVSPFVRNLQYLITELKKGEAKGVIDLIVDVVNKFFETLSRNDGVINIIDAYLQTLATILLFNPLTGPILRAIGVGTAPFIAYSQFSERNKEELDEVTRYLTEVTPSSEERAVQLIENMKTQGNKDRIMTVLGELKRNMLAARVTLGATDITRQAAEGDAATPAPTATATTAAAAEVAAEAGAVAEAAAEAGAAAAGDVEAAGAAAARAGEAATRAGEATARVGEATRAAGERAAGERAEKTPEQLVADAPAGAVGDVETETEGGISVSPIPVPPPQLNQTQSN